VSDQQRQFDRTAKSQRESSRAGFELRAARSSCFCEPFFRVADRGENGTTKIDELPVVNSLK
jgi:hypothetical protein